MTQYDPRRFVSKAFFTVKSILTEPIDILRLHYLDQSIRHIHGPIGQEITIKPNEAVVLCVVKNGQSLIRAFIEHYLKSGFKHIFFLDNGSTDETINIIKTHPKTTLISSDKPFRSHYVIFKNYLIKKFGQHRWCVIADVDEFLYFPIEKSLTDIINYLNKHQYDAVAIQMLDMFSGEDIKAEKTKRVWALEDLKTAFRYCDLNNICERRYVRQLLSRPHPSLKFLTGGIRKTIFGTNSFLTKEAMFYGHEKTYLKSSHLLKHAKAADFSALFLHYKFIDDFPTYTLHAVREKNHWRGSKEYKAYLSVLSGKESLVLLQPSSFELKNVDELIEKKFLYVSSQFRDFWLTEWGDGE
jgi:glycosyltransferase involved in cell wall biosynthesis